MQRVAENLPHGPRTLQAAQEGSESNCFRPTFLPLPPWESPRQIVQDGFDRQPYFNPSATPTIQNVGAAFRRPWDGKPVPYGFGFIHYSLFSIHYSLFSNFHVIANCRGRRPRRPVSWCGNPFPPAKELRIATVASLPRNDMVFGNSLFSTLNSQLSTLNSQLSIVHCGVGVADDSECRGGVSPPVGRENASPTA